MRSFVLLSAVLIASSLDRSNDIDESYEKAVKFITVMFFVGFAMDVYELLCK